MELEERLESLFKKIADISAMVRNLQEENNVLARKLKEKEDELAKKDQLSTMIEQYEMKLKKYEQERDILRTKIERMIDELDKLSVHEEGDLSKPEEGDAK